MNKNRYRIGVLTSGMSRGSNLLAIRNWFNENQLPVDISFVVVTHRRAPVIERCQYFGLEHIFVSTKDMTEFEERVLTLISEREIDLIVLAGFLKKLSAEFLDKAAIPTLNIHPALLPKYGGEGMYGSNVHKEVFQNKESESGATVHYVNKHYDDGEIILQRKVDLEGCESPEQVAERVLKIEHDTYAPAIWEALQRHRKL
ncbi:MAG: phosphoribosylglycinamide formyltransferase [Candidatus Cloacimonadia bacterium]